MPTPPSFHLRLIVDTLASSSTLGLPEDRINRVIYVANGAIDVAGHTYATDTAWHGRGAGQVLAGPDGATLWRWELAAPEVPAVAVDGAGRSVSLLSAPLSWPIADAVLMRADSVSFPPGGCAYLHTHQGPGIRCLIDGGIRIDTDGHATSYAPGCAWFEAGPVPVFAQAVADRPSRFVRVMILPARLKGQSSIAYVNAEDRDKPKSQSYKIFVDSEIETDG